MRRLRARDRERYLDAVDEPREHVRLAGREYYDTLDALDELEECGSVTRASRPTILTGVR